jgi:hypothetical protein
MTKTRPKEPTNETKSFSRKKRKSSKRLSNSGENDSGQQPPTKKSQKRPFNGLVVAISTSNEKRNSDTEITYSSVAQICKELGAEVLGQVGKRVQYMICTQSAVQQATQRVRKAFKKKIPIVDVSWVEECRVQRKRVDISDYKLDKEAEKAIRARQTQNEVLESTNNVDEVPQDEIPPDDAGWTDAVTLGCCCVCHENQAEKDCVWCKDLDCAKK